MSGRPWTFAIATLVAMVVVPTPPFGLNTATVRRARAIDTPSDATTDEASRVRLNRRRSASTRASSSRLSNGLAITSSAPASRNAIRSSTASVWLMHRTGIPTNAGSARIWLHRSGAVTGPTTTSMTTSWCAGAAASVPTASAVRVTL